MAKKQVTVNEELLRGIMAGDVPVYGKNAPKDVIIDEESVEEDIQEKGDDTGGHDMKSAVRQKKRKDESGSYRRQFLKGGNIQLETAGLYQSGKLPVHTEIPVRCGPGSQYVKIYR